METTALGRNDDKGIQKGDEAHIRIIKSWK